MNRVVIGKWVGTCLALNLAAFSAKAADPVETTASKPSANCARAKIASGSTCEDLRIEFDLSDCGARQKTRTEKPYKCNQDSATARTRYKGNWYVASAQGASWGGKTNWTLAPALQLEPVASADVKKAAEPKAEPKKENHPVDATAAKNPTEPLTPVTPAPSPSVAAKPVVSASPAPAASPTPYFWSLSPAGSSDSNLSIGGDFRVRYEKVTQKDQPVKNQQQQRIRARIGAKAKFSDDLLTEIRLATGNGRASTNQTLGSSSGSTNSGFSNYDFKLDRAYLRWTLLPGVAYTGGRIPNPYYNPAESDLIWDTDLNFDGNALNLEQKVSSKVTLFETATLFWVDKKSDSSTTRGDTLLNSFQLGSRMAFSPEVKWGTEVAYHNFTGIQGHPVFTSFSGNSSTGTPAGYTYGFKIVEIGTDLNFPLFGQSFTLIFQVARNRAAPLNRDAALAGFRIGTLKEARDLQFAYDLRWIEKDALIGMFADGDSYGGGSDGRSHRIALNYLVKKNLSAAAVYYTGQKNIAPGETSYARNKVHLDLSIRF